jgi:hypothetical protein
MVNFELERLLFLRSQWSRDAVRVFERAACILVLVGYSATFVEPCDGPRRRRFCATDGREREQKGSENPHTSYVRLSEELV